jgi:hypothetical protein
VLATAVLTAVLGLAALLAFALTHVRLLLTLLHRLVVELDRLADFFVVLPPALVLLRLTGLRLLLLAILVLEILVAHVPNSFRRLAHAAVTGRRNEPLARLLKEQSAYHQL